MLLKAPSKINLTLKILSKRADGYHEIDSLMRAVDLCDDVELEIRKNTGIANFRLRTDNQNLPDGPKNLAWQAAELAVCELSGGEWTGDIDISIKKNIPIAAGLAGGSTDAAAVLLAVAKEIAPEVSLSELATLGAKIGADIPFCLYACAMANPSLGYKGTSAALVGGVGELITPLAEPEKAWVVLVNPGIEIRAKDAYKLYDIFSDTQKNEERNNDLELVCAGKWPEVAETISTLKTICIQEEANGAKVQLSGSGPTVFAYFGLDQFKDEAETKAYKVFKRAEAAFKDFFVCLKETL